jgi:hypothetical protein
VKRSNAARARRDDRHSAASTPPRKQPLAPAACNSPAISSCKSNSDCPALSSVFGRRRRRALGKLDAAPQLGGADPARDRQCGELVRHLRRSPVEEAAEVREVVEPRLAGRAAMIAAAGTVKAPLAADGLGTGAAAGCPLFRPLGSLSNPIQGDNVYPPRPPRKRSAMATQNEHGRLIAAAAKAALAPIGCFRRGQSRVWLSDERYWAIMVEFQPSGFSKGSYLNVGASWMWSETRRDLVFNVGYRVSDAGFIPFESVSQFGPLIEKMAERAGREVLAFRAKFPTIGAISQFLTSTPKATLWQLYHVAVALALSGQTEASRRAFREIALFPVSAPWQAEVQAESAALAGLLNETARLRQAIGNKIERVREIAGLPVLTDCLRGV